MKSQEKYTIRNLIFLFITGNLSEKEKEVLNEWRKEKPSNEKLFLKITSHEHLNQSFKKFVRDDSFNQKEWMRIKSRTIDKGKRYKMTFITKYAAILIVPIIAGAIIYLQYNKLQERSREQRKEKLEMVTHKEAKAILVLSNGNTILLDSIAQGTQSVSTATNAQLKGDTLDYSKVEQASTEEKAINKLMVKRGASYNLLLSDGSLIYLNAESELSYPVHFTDTERKVSLNGQAFFEVASDPKRPFKVDIGNIQIEVLGTSFDIQAYKSEENVTTTLTHGKVKLKANGSSYELTPGQQAIFDNQSGDITIKNVDIEQYIAWKSGRIIFESTPLRDIMTYLSRLYDVDILFENKSKESIPFSINITKHNNFYEIAELLEKTNQVTIVLDQNENNKFLIIK